MGPPRPALAAGEARSDDGDEEPESVVDGLLAADPPLLCGQPDLFLAQGFDARLLRGPTGLGLGGLVVPMADGRLEERHEAQEVGAARLVVVVPPPVVAEPVPDREGRAVGDPDHHQPVVTSSPSGVEPGDQGRVTVGGGQGRDQQRLELAQVLLRLVALLGRRLEALRPWGPRCARPR